MRASQREPPIYTRSNPRSLHRPNLDTIVSTTGTATATPTQLVEIGNLHSGPTSTTSANLVQVGGFHPGHFQSSSFRHELENLRHVLLSKFCSPAALTHHLEAFEQFVFRHKPAGTGQQLESFQHLPLSGALLERMRSTRLV